MKRYLYVALTLFLGCTKIELPVQMEPKPIFEIKATLGNKPLNLSAGINGIEMVTNYQVQPLQVINLEGILRKKDCSPPCKESLQVTLRENNMAVSNPREQFSLIGKKTFYTTNRDSLKIKIKSNSIIPSNPIAKYTTLWTVNDEKILNKEQFDIYTINPEKKIHICQYITGTDGTATNQCQTLDLNQLDSFPGLKVNLQLVVRDNKSTMLEAKINGKGPFKVVWNNKPGTIGPSSSTFSEIDTRILSIQCVEVTDVFGNKASACIEINPGGKIKSKADFIMDFDEKQLLRWAQYASVELIYVDETGTVWNSATKLNQTNFTSYFEVLSDERFEPNGQKQNTRKLTFKSNSQLFNKNGMGLPFNLTGSFAVAVPQ